ncbi:MAG: hypothetical protein E7547_05290 [Ruminococcaceae bacterium]|nr:hypothetical protein [Oscillospiraceae bacterium]
MKKYFALIISVIIILSCFTACKPKIKNGAVISDAASKNYAAVTEEGGEIARDEAGNLLLLVTDEHGRNVKDENGEYETKRVKIDHALVVGNKIECADYALTIPNGWSDKMSYADLIISRDGTEDILKISVTDDSSLNNVMETRLKSINLIKNNFPKAETGSKEITLGDEIIAQFSYAFVEDTGARDENLNVLSSYLGFIFFEHKGEVYTCMLTSNRNMTEQIDEIAGILNTIEFI